MRFFSFIRDWAKGDRALVPGALRLVLVILLGSSFSCGYTVLTHEAIIDSVWVDSLQKLLLKRFPDATPEQLDQAHAYAYGLSLQQPSFQRSHALRPQR
jgi:hypothetical protein